MLKIAKQSFSSNGQGVILDIENKRDVDVSNPNTPVFPDVLKNKHPKNDRISSLVKDNSPTTFDLTTYFNFDTIRLFKTDKVNKNDKKIELTYNLCKAIRNKKVTFSQIQHLHPFIKNNGNIFIECLHLNFIETLRLYFDKNTVDSSNYKSSPLIVLRREKDNIDFHKMIFILTDKNLSEEDFVQHVRDLGELICGVVLTPAILFILKNIPLKDLFLIIERYDKILSSHQVHSLGHYVERCMIDINKIANHRLASFEELEDDEVDPSYSIKDYYNFLMDRLFNKRSVISPSRHGITLALDENFSY